MTPSELKAYVQKHGAKMIDAKFVDFLGQWKHLTYPIERLEEGLEEGFGFDGSSIAGWRAINSSDMLMKPDPTSAVMDPFLKTTGIADTAYFGPEAEFFVFDSIQYSEDPSHSFYRVDSDEGGWNSKRDEGGGNKGSK